MTFVSSTQTRQNGYDDIAHFCMMGHILLGKSRKCRKDRVTLI